MIDLKWLREHQDEFDSALARRGADPQAAAVLALDVAKRSIETALQNDQSRRNQLSKEIGQKRGPDGKPPADLLAEVGALKNQIKTGGDRLRDADQALRDALAALPNILAADVPDGADESFNREERRVGTPREFAFKPLPHEELGPALGMDFAAAARISGARFVALRGNLARLERALGSYMLDVQTGEHGYAEMSVPLMVHDQALFGTGQLPKFADQQFQTNTGHWLIPTAEVSLTNMVREEILPAEQLPLRFTAFTPCFRSEAGAAGRDTKGMIRQHQFLKVELVSITDAESSNDEHERMTACAETILKRLELPYRVMTLAAGDTGFGARKTYDLEVWLPGQAAYREISSCSNCGDFQARRMNTRYRAKGEKSTQFVHTLNGSGLAVGRTLIAVLENYQQADGSVVVPEVLRPYMAGLERLEPAVA